MALTVVKYRKTATGQNEIVSTPTPAILIKSRLVQQQQHLHQQNMKKSFLKIDTGTGLIINKIPATIKPAMKRNTPIAAAVEPVLKSTKYPLQTIASAGTPLTSFQWQQTIGGTGGTVITTTTQNLPKQQQQIGAAINSLPANTIIQATNSTSNSSSSNNGSTNAFIQTNGGTTITPSGGNALNTLTATQGAATTVQVRRPTIFIKRETPKRTIRTITVELIEKNPLVHLGITTNRLSLLKNVICTRTNVPLADCYLTLKKLRQNEDFSLLAEYFEITELEVQQIFANSVVKLASYLRYLIRWPDSKSYYDRHKYLPFAFRANLSNVQSMIECVETDMHRPMNSTLDCSQYKFILCITPNNIITYISDAYIGNLDDLTIFSASNFQNAIPKYLSMVADPGKGIRRKRKSKSHTNSASGGCMKSTETDSTTDSADESADEMDNNVDVDENRTISKYAATRIAGEIAADQTLEVVNSELISTKTKDISIPTMRVREPVCRQQIRHIINCMREFRVLQPYAIQEPMLFQYLNEMLVVVAALTNLQQ